MAVQSVEETCSYDDKCIEAAVAAHMERLGAAKLLFPGIKVVIKPNLVSAHSPDRAVTTHPSIVAAVAGWLKKNGADDIEIAESPGGPYTPALLNAIYSRCGYAGLEGTVSLNRGTDYVEVPLPDGVSIKSANIITPIAEADLVINIAKLKTHSMTILSCGVKNMFGAVPGLQKPGLHYRFKDARAFADMLVDIALITSPAITIIDAVDCMEGNGPSAGTVRHAGLTFASQNIFAQDYYIAGLMGMDPAAIPTIAASIERVLFDPGDIEVAGATPPLISPPLMLPDSARIDFLSRFPLWLRRPAGFVINSLLLPRPSVDASVCVGCGKCAEMCPPKIIRIENNKAVIPPSGCISCFCCQEICPVRAVNIRRRFIGSR